MKEAAFLLTGMGEAAGLLLTRMDRWSPLKAQTHSCHHTQSSR